MLSGAVLEIEVPYEIYNMTSGNIETGIHEVTSKVSFELTYVFQLFAFVMIFFSVVYSMMVPIISVLRKYGVIKSPPKKKNDDENSLGDMD